MNFKAVFVLFVLISSELFLQSAAFVAAAGGLSGKKGRDLGGCVEVTKYFIFIFVKLQPLSYNRG